MSLRIDNHVILGDLNYEEKKKIHIFVDDLEIEAIEGEPILSALLANGILVNRFTVKRHEPRGLFCGIGQCTDCAMIVDGKMNVRTCVTPAKDGMVVKTQDGMGMED